MWASPLSAAPWPPLALHPLLCSPRLHPPFFAPPSLHPSFTDCCMPRPVLSVRDCVTCGARDLPPQFLPHHLAWPGSKVLCCPALTKPTLPPTQMDKPPPSSLEWPSRPWGAVAGPQRQGQAGSTHHGSNQTHFCFCFYTTLPSSCRFLSFRSLLFPPPRGLSPLLTCLYVSWHWHSLSSSSLPLLFLASSFLPLPSFPFLSVFYLCVCPSVFHSVPLSWSSVCSCCC